MEARQRANEGVWSLGVPAGAQKKPVAERRRDCDIFGLEHNALAPIKMKYRGWVYKRGTHNKKTTVNTNNDNRKKNEYLTTKVRNTDPSKQALEKTFINAASPLGGIADTNAFGKDDRIARSTEATNPTTAFSSSEFLRKNT